MAATPVDIRPPRLMVLPGGAYDAIVVERQLLEELESLLMRLGDGASPVQRAVIQTWLRTVRSWLRAVSRGH